MENVKNDLSLPKKKKIKSENSEFPITPKSEKSSKNNTPFVDEPSIKYDVNGVDNALIIINKFINNGYTDKDKHFLEVFRQYGTYNDLLVVLKALEDQRDLISSKLKPYDEITDTDNINKNNDDLIEMKIDDLK
jgi:hypothetical protein